MEQDYLCISWKNLPWSLFRRKIFHLQCKIYEAKKSGDFRLLRRLQKLLIDSKSSHFIATRFLVNATVHSQYRFSDSEKIILAYSIRTTLKKGFYLDRFQPFQPSESLESAKVLVLQYVLRLALEPIYYDKMFWLLSEQGGDTLKLVKKIRSYLKKASDLGANKVLKFELSSCLENIPYNLIRKNLCLPIKYKLFLYKSITEDSFNNDLLKDIVADCLRSSFISSVTKMNTFSLLNAESSISQKKISLGRFGFTYSNMVVCFLEDKDSFYNYVDSLKILFRNHGLTLNLSSIYISVLDQGFDFFGWFFKRIYNKRISVSLSYTNWVLYKKSFKSIVKRNCNTLIKIKKLTFLNFSWVRNYCIVSRSILKNKFYFLRRSVLRYSKSLKSLEKKVLFRSFKFQIPF